MVRYAKINFDLTSTSGRWHMNALKLTLSLIIILFIVSCVTSQSSPTGSDHQKGYNMAGEFAKKDAMNYTCFGYRRYIRMGFAEHKARKYTKLLQDQGRSEAFIKGFYRGYENYYREFLDLYCGP
jgi:hypothetical protein